ncbi:carotenoid oxygenase family protein [Streptomyces mirabilis]|uniref:carotenoid oxygenase family protein n=1 Tax=Streptomyces mirabilis TaxID=68239 RepID=UPI0036D8843B
MSPDLDTLGKETFGGALPSGITAHPKVDPLTGETAIFCYGLLAVAHRQRVRLVRPVQ